MNLAAYGGLKERAPERRWRTPIKEGLRHAPDGFARFTAAAGDRVQVVGDDLLRALKPEVGDSSQDFTLAGDRFIHHDIKGGQPVFDKTAAKETT